MSTFDSDPKKWARIWILALALSALVLGSMELHWRARGFRPSVSDNVDISLWHDGLAAADDDPRALVVIGSSRALFGFVPSVFSRLYPHYHVHQLAIDGAHPLGLLHRLAEDPHFKGIILCEMTEEAFFPEYRELPEKYREPRGGPGFFMGPLDRLAAFVQSHLVVLNQQLTLSHLIQANRTGPWPIWREPDRSLSCGPGLASNREWIHQVAENSVEKSHPRSREEESEWLRIPEEDARKLGNRLVFVRFPVNSGLQAVYDSFFPKFTYWNRFAHESASPVLNLTEPAEGALIPDDSHLCGASAAAFTRELVGRLARIGFIRAE